MSGRRVARRGVLALCERLDGAPGATRYGNGRVELRGVEETAIVEPPFGLAHEGAYDRCEVGPLREHLLAPRTVGLVVVRRGGYGAAVYRDEEVLSAKAGSRFVKGRNRKGGSSSGRFTRRREEQARDALDRAAATAEAILEPHERAIEHLVLTGDRLALLAVLERSALLRRLEPLRIPLPIDVPEPRRATLDALAREVWSSVVEQRDPT